MFICAQLLGLLAALFNMAAMYVSDRKQILLFLMLASLSFMLNMLCLGAISGAVVNVIQLFQLLINYLYDAQGKKYPIYLIIIYIVVALLCGFATFTGPIDIFPVIASILFSVSILQTDERKLKMCMLFMFLAWAIYSFVVMAYSTAIVDILEFIATGIFLIKASKMFRKGEVL